MKKNLYSLYYVILVIKNSSMSSYMQEVAITVAQDAISTYTTEQEIATAIKNKFEKEYPSK
jgi:hypothetical protein